MIRPRPTLYTIATRDDVAGLVPHDLFRDRPPRYCPCGTKLRRSKNLSDTLCDPCSQRLERERPIDELHPHRIGGRIEDTCPSCGGPMYHQANHCRRCTPC